MPDQFTEQLKKLETLRHTADSSALEEFDEETERLILQRFGEAARQLEAYELAMMGEAESIVNMPQAAQEDTTQDLFHKGIEQRRQVLEACLADVMEAAARPVTRQATVAKKPRAAKRKNKATKEKAGAVRKAARKSAKRKKPAAARKKKTGPAKRKKTKRR
jgi:hypothetical protein